ncbi:MULTISPECIES: YraN family protein [Kocuria]|uniref:YraN family protein n=1 Tax=Kocuria TaxID=57493 RepID=UPI001E2F55DD|nr:YraN family protein [Kocuria sp. CPCC 104605]
MSSGSVIAGCCRNFRGIAWEHPVETNLNARQSLGRVGEEIAVEYLQARGAEILARNWRAQKSHHGVTGELDVVLRLGPVVVGVEVKTRSGVGYGHPLESITPVKLRRLHLLLAAWTSENGHHARPRRIDAVAVMIRRRPGRPTAVSVEHRPGLT